MSDQFKTANKKLLKWAQNLATDPHEFTHVLYNQARSIAELKATIQQLKLENRLLRGEETFAEWIEHINRPPS